MDRTRQFVGVVMQILAGPHAGGILANYLVVAGGGGAASGNSAGGGGAGGARCSVDQTGGLGSLETMFTVVPGVTYTVTIGAGGAGSNYPITDYGVQGNNSSIIGTSVSITSTGGGYSANNLDGGNGGSGGGGSGGGVAYLGGTRTASPVQGFDGGDNNGVTPFAGGGGGGGGAEGVAGGNSGLRPNGGIGIQTTLSGVATYYAGGGGAGYRDSMGALQGGLGGSGGGGNGAVTSSSAGSPGSANTGGGGGGAGGIQNGGSGGSGIVIINAGIAAVSTTGSPTVSGTIYTFTGSGSITY